LPLPRPVGVESDDELLALRIARDANEPPVASYQSQIGADLFAQLPDGFELVSVRGQAPVAGTSFQPSSARYILPVGAECVDEELRTTIGRLLASENLYIRRQITGKRSRPRNVDVRVFLESLELDGQDIIAECRISPAGSIRVDEILELLGLDHSNLAAPIRRTNVQWQSLLTT